MIFILRLPSWALRCYCIITTTSLHSEDGVNCVFNVVVVLLQHQGWYGKIQINGLLNEVPIRCHKVLISRDERLYCGEFRHLESLCPTEETLTPKLREPLRKLLTFFYCFILEGLKLLQVPCAERVQRYKAYTWWEALNELTSKS